jgi:ABC-type Fe3+/spermidine/putrescine transport system ATPase subunit
VTARAEGDAPRPGERTTLAIRPEKIVVGPPEPGDNALAGRVVGESYAGDRSTLVVRVPGLAEPLLVTVPNARRSLAAAAPDGEVALSWRPDAAALLAD